jgi:hypothetical protein
VFARDADDQRFERRYTALSPIALLCAVATRWLPVVGAW